MRSSITHPRMLHPLARPPTRRPTHHLRQTPLHHTMDRARPASRRTLLPTGVLSISSSRPTAARSNTIHPSAAKPAIRRTTALCQPRRPLSRTVAIPATKPKGMAARHTKERCPRREKGRSSEYTSLFLFFLFAAPRNDREFLWFIFLASSGHQEYKFDEGTPGLFRRDPIMVFDALSGAACMRGGSSGCRYFVRLSSRNKDVALPWREAELGGEGGLSFSLIDV